MVAFGRARGTRYGFAVAFLSLAGYATLRRLPRFDARRAQLIVGLDNCVTTPAGLHAAADDGVSIRVGVAVGGLFHPKLYMLKRGSKVNAFYIGSANATGRAFGSNIELGFFSDDEAECTDVSELYAALWAVSKPLTKRGLKSYSARWKEVNSRRLQSNDVILEEADVDSSRQQMARSDGSVGIAMVPKVEMALYPEDADLVWISLETVTGGGLQIEIPRALVEILAAIGFRPPPDENTVAMVGSDGALHRFTHRYYGNAMQRLTVPNGVPNFEFVRTHRSGIATISREQAGSFRFELVVDPDAVRIVVGRSIAFGSLGRTPTRTFGWL